MAAASDPKTGLTVKQTAFCRAYFETGNAAQAYRESYDVSENAQGGWIRVEACQLLDNPNITQEIERLQAEAARLSLYTVKAAFDELEEARQLAKTVGQPGAAVSAINAKMKLFGLERAGQLQIEHTGKDGGAIKTEDASAALLLKAHLDTIARRTSGAS
jgi:phage terminase small subunit